MGLEVGMGQSGMPENTHSPPCLPEEWSLHLLFSFSFSFSFDDGGIRNRFVPLRSLGTLMEKQIEIVFWRRFAKPLQGRFPFSFFPSLPLSVVARNHWPMKIRETAGLPLAAPSFICLYLPALSVSSWMEIVEHSVTKIFPEKESGLEAVKCVEKRWQTIKWNFTSMKLL